MTANSGNPAEQIAQILSQVGATISEIQLQVLDVQKFKDTAIAESLQDTKSEMMAINHEISKLPWSDVVVSMKEIFHHLSGITKDNIGQKANCISRECHRALTASNLVSNGLRKASKSMRALCTAAHAQSSDLGSRAVELEAREAAQRSVSRTYHTLGCVTAFTGVGLLFLIPAKVFHDQANASQDQKECCSLAKQDLMKALIPVAERISSTYEVLSDLVQDLQYTVGKCAHQAKKAEEARLDIERHRKALPGTEGSFDDAQAKSAEESCLEAMDELDDAWDQITDISFDLEAQLDKLGRKMQRLVDL